MGVPINVEEISVSVNNLVLSGNLAKDVDIKVANSGTTIAAFTVAHTPRKKVNGEWTDGSTIWLDVTAFGSLAESVAELTKGTPVVVNGRIEVDEWEDKQSGAKRSKIVAIASDMSLGVKRVKADTQQSSSNPASDW